MKKHTKLILILLIFLSCMAAKNIMPYTKISAENKKFTDFSKKVEKQLSSKDIEMYYYVSEDSAVTSLYWYQLKFPKDNIEKCIEITLDAFNEEIKKRADLFYNGEKIRLVIFNGKINKSSCYEITIKYDGYDFSVYELQNYPQDLELIDYMSIKCLESTEVLVLSNFSYNKYYDDLSAQMEQGIEKFSNLKSLSFYDSYVDLKILNSTHTLETLKVYGGTIRGAEEVKKSSSLKSIELKLDDISDDEKQELLKIREEFANKNIDLFINGKVTA